MESPRIFGGQIGLNLWRNLWRNLWNLWKTSSHSAILLKNPNQGHLRAIANPKYTD